jgi:hypothetical protein
LASIRARSLATTPSTTADSISVSSRLIGKGQPAQSARPPKRRSTIAKAIAGSISSTTWPFKGSMLTIARVVGPGTERTNSS